MGELKGPLAADLDNFIDWLRGQGMAATTVDKRSLIVAGRLAEWGRWDVRPSVITAWLGRYDGWSRCTYDLHLRSAYKFALDWGIVDVDPTAAIKRPRTPAPQPHPLSPLQLTRAMETATPTVARYMRLAHLAGLRAHEVAKFRGEDITESSLTVVGKGGVQAVLPTHPALWELAQDMPTEGYWFPSQTARGHVAPNSVSALVAAHLRTVGVTKGGLHRVRASYGTELLRSGANIRVVQRLLRHATLSATEHYLAVAEDELSAAVRLLVA